jgi:hypothetical protein
MVATVASSASHHHGGGIPISYTWASSQINRARDPTG